MPRWKRNAIILCLAQLLTLTGFSSYFSFIPFYIQELGVSDYQEVLSWLATFSSGAAVAMMFSAPLWGSLADRYGRKMMLIRATAAGAILAFLMGLAQSPLQLVILRILQGAFCGTVSASLTMVTTETPEEHLGMWLGMMQTTQFVGHAVGPLIGGLAADAFGYRTVFTISSIMMALSVTMVTFLVKERFQPRKKTARSASGRERIATLLTRSTVALLLLLGSVRFATAVLSPILSLYVQSLSADATRIATLAGAVTSVAAITCSLSALAIGRLGDKLSQKAVLIVCSVGLALLQIPQAFVSSASQLLIWRALQGVFYGGTMPTANALLAKSTPSSRRGTIFGLATSVMAGGRALGPIVGAGVAGAWGMPSVFLVTAAAFAVISAIAGFMVKVTPQANGVPMERAPTQETEALSAPHRACKVPRPPGS